MPGPHDPPDDLTRLQRAFTRHHVPWPPRGVWPHGKRQATHAASAALVTAFITHVPPTDDWKLTLQTLAGAYLAWPDLQGRALNLLAARFGAPPDPTPDTEQLQAFLTAHAQPWARRTHPPQVRQLLHPTSAELSRALKASCEARFPQALKDLYVTLTALYCLDAELRGRIDAAVRVRAAA